MRVLGFDGDYLRKLVLVTVGALVAACLVALVGTAKPGEAAFPGQNGKIAFIREVNRVSQVFTMGPAGGKQTQLTFNDTGSYSPAWSPGGRKIAFGRYSASSGSKGIYIMNADGSHKVPLTTSKKDDFDPAWSPSGQRLVFVREVIHTVHRLNVDLLTVSRDGSDVIRLTRTEEREWNPAWSPDGGTIAFSKYAWSQDCGEVGLFVMQADGSEEPSMLASPDDIGCPNYMFGADWSPDGQWIVFGTADYDSCCYTYKVRADGTEPTFVTHSAGAQAWSPDGTKIVFTNYDGGLYKMNPDGTNKKRIVEGPEGLGFASSWQPLN
jgi:TolB protein